jgi:hypothetical protein
VPCTEDSGIVAGSIRTLTSEVRICAELTETRSVEYRLIVIIEVRTFSVQTNMASRLFLMPLNELPANGYTYLFVNW